MDKAYRVCFFGEGASQATAVLVLHFASDKAAEEEALHLLSASALSRVEVWHGARMVWRSAAAPAWEPLAAHALCV